MDTAFDAVPELAPAWKRYPRLASEMHCTTAHRLISHIYILPVHQQNQQSRRFLQPHPSFLASRASYSKPTWADVNFRRSSFYFLRCGRLERHAAKPHLATLTTSSHF